MLLSSSAGKSGHSQQWSRDLKSFCAQRLLIKVQMCCKAGLQLRFSSTACHWCMIIFSVSAFVSLTYTSSRLQGMVVNSHNTGAAA